jgi:hypothetical protein
MEPAIIAARGITQASTRAGTGRASRGRTPAPALARSHVSWRRASCRVAATPVLAQVRRGRPPRRGTPTPGGTDAAHRRHRAGSSASAPAQRCELVDEPGRQHRVESASRSRGAGARRSFGISAMRNRRADGVAGTPAMRCAARGSRQDSCGAGRIQSRADTSSERAGAEYATSEFVGEPQARGGRADTRDAREHRTGAFAIPSNAARRAPSARRASPAASPRRPPRQARNRPYRPTEGLEVQPRGRRRGSGRVRRAARCPPTQGLSVGARRSRPAEYRPSVGSIRVVCEVVRPTPGGGVGGRRAVAPVPTVTAKARQGQRGPHMRRSADGDDALVRPPSASASASASERALPSSQLSPCGPISRIHGSR